MTTATVRDTRQQIEAAGEELGKSLAKVLHSEKYREFHGDYTDLVMIMAVASNTAINIIEKEELERGQEHAALAAKSMSDTWDKKFGAGKNL